MKLDSKPGALMALLPSELAAHASMLAAEASQHLPTNLALFGGVLQRETRQFVRLFDRDLLTGSGPRTWISHMRQRRAPVSESRHYGGYPASMQQAQAGVDGGQRLPALCCRSSALQIALGGVDRAYRVPGRTDGIAHGLAGFLNSIAGLAVFGGSLARPVQGTRYRSLSKSLPLSRTSQ